MTSTTKKDMLLDLIFHFKDDAKDFISKDLIFIKLRILQNRKF